MIDYLKLSSKIRQPAVCRNIRTAAFSIVRLVSRRCGYRGERTMDEGGNKKEGVSLKALVNRLAGMDVERIGIEVREEQGGVVNQTPGFDSFRMNPTKNRYHGNIFLYDHTRVILRDNPGGDYIHASYISTPQSKTRYIVTQAPLPETIDDFWWMIGQERAQVIVALCQFDSPGTQSEDPFPMYWPHRKGESPKRGRFQVKHVEAVGSQSTMITTLKMAKDGDPRFAHHVEHIHLRVAGWDDRGVPTGALQDLITSVWEMDEQASKLNYSSTPLPIVIHCGSGTARSGQFCAFSIATEAIRKGWPFSLKDVICSLQSQRYGVLREPAQVTALCYALVEFGKRHRLLRDEKVDQVLQALKERIS